MSAEQVKQQGETQDEVAKPSRIMSPEDMKQEMQRQQGTGKPAWVMASEEMAEEMARDNCASVYLGPSMSATERHIPILAAVVIQTCWRRFRVFKHYVVKPRRAFEKIVKQLENVSCVEDSVYRVVWKSPAWLCRPKEAPRLRPTTSGHSSNGARQSISGASTKVTASKDACTLCHPDCFSETRADREGLEGESSIDNVNSTDVEIKLNLVENGHVEKKEIMGKVSDSYHVPISKGDVGLVSDLGEQSPPPSRPPSEETEKGDSSTDIGRTSDVGNVSCLEGNCRPQALSLSSSEEEEEEEDIHLIESQSVGELDIVSQMGETPFPLPVVQACVRVFSEEATTIEVAGSSEEFDSDEESESESEHATVVDVLYNVCEPVLSKEAKALSETSVVQLRGDDFGFHAPVVHRLDVAPKPFNMYSLNKVEESPASRGEAEVETNVGSGDTPLTPVDPSVAPPPPPPDSCSSAGVDHDVDTPPVLADSNPSEEEEEGDYEYYSRLVSPPRVTSGSRKERMFCSERFLQMISPTKEAQDKP